MTATRSVPRLWWPSDAVLLMPGSKSDANRLLVAAAARGLPCPVRGVTASDDVRRMLAGLRTLGFAVTHEEPTATVVLGARDARAPTRGELHCGNAGTALRFLVSLAAITPGEWVLTGEPAMLRRPIGALTAAWRSLGIDCTDTNGCPPVHVRGGTPRDGRVELDPSASSQFVSSLLLVGAALPAGIDVTFRGDLASAGYARWTVATLARLGVRAQVRDDGARVDPGFGAAADLPVELRASGDWSSMGVWTCLGHLTGSRVRAANLTAEGVQPDEELASLLAAMPATGEHRIDCTTMPDQFCNLAIVAAHRRGTTRVIGGANLRHKECDRIAVMARELGKLGAGVQELPDGLLVRSGRSLRGGTVDPANDHRVAMAFALLGLSVPGIAIAEPDCVTKSYPHFWADLATVARERRCIAVVGMRGAGKSTFARAFAAATGARAIDTDADFVAAHGPIAAFVARHGWPAFRAHEHRLSTDALLPGTVVALGGGALEHGGTREQLRRAATVVWLDGDAALLRARLAADPGARPSLTGASITGEVDDVLARRRPLYADVATVRLDAGTPTTEQVAATLTQLGSSCRWPGGTTG
jgi:3-phosphoshikimate 1-carboxyvinyltransferase